MHISICLFAGGEEKGKKKPTLDLTEVSQRKWRSCFLAGTRRISATAFCFLLEAQSHILPRASIN